MHTFSPILEQLADIYRLMDAAYQETAQAYGFVCNGCEDNCCRSRFYHHTIVEHLFLQAGLDRLTIERCREVTRRSRDIHRQGMPAGSLCPLNEAGRCLLYDFRPMICRLHGIPHRLLLPDGRVHDGPGCASCERLPQPEAERRLDRTPFYQAVAELEQEARRLAGWTGKRRMTIAEMVLSRPGRPTGAPREDNGVAP